MFNSRERFWEKYSQDDNSNSLPIPLFQHIGSKFDVPRTEREKRRLPAVPMTAEMRAQFQERTEYDWFDPRQMEQPEPVRGYQPALEIEAERIASGRPLRESEIFDAEAEINRAYATLPQFNRAQPKSLPEEVDNFPTSRKEVEAQISLASQIFHSLFRRFQRGEK